MGNLTGITHDGHLPCQIYHDCNWQEYSKHLHGIFTCERLDYDSKQIDHFQKCLGALLRPGLQTHKEKAASSWVCNDKPLVCIRQRGELITTRGYRRGSKASKRQSLEDRIVPFITPTCPPLHTCLPPGEGHIHTWAY